MHAGDYYNLLQLYGLCGAYIVNININLHALKLLINNLVIICYK